MMNMTKKVYSMSSPTIRIRLTYKAPTIQQSMHSPQVSISSPHNSSGTMETSKHKVVSLINTHNSSNPSHSILHSQLQIKHSTKLISLHTYHYNHNRNSPSNYNHNSKHYSSMPMISPQSIYHQILNIIPPIHSSYQTTIHKYSIYNSQIRKHPTQIIPSHIHQDNNQKSFQDKHSMDNSKKQKKSIQHSQYTQKQISLSPKRYYNSSNHHLSSICHSKHNNQHYKIVSTYCRVNNHW